MAGSFLSVSKKTSTARLARPHVERRVARHPSLARQLRRHRCVDQRGANDDWRPTHAIGSIDQHDERRPICRDLVVVAEHGQRSARLIDRGPVRDAIAHSPDEAALGDGRRNACVAVLALSLRSVCRANRANARRCGLAPPAHDVAHPVGPAGGRRTERGPIGDVHVVGELGAAARTATPDPDALSGERRRAGKAGHRNQFACGHTAHRTLHGDRLCHSCSISVLIR
jgi:hypothetical protein